jgi:hypothetical protein
MEARPELAAILDIYANEICSKPPNGKILSIKTNNATIRALLETLFYDTLDIEENMYGWARSLCKYGDFALFLDQHPDNGILNATRIPVTSFQRIEGINPHSPTDVMYRISPQAVQAGGGLPATYLGVATAANNDLGAVGGYSMSSINSLFRDRADATGGITLQDWQVIHFRSQGNDMFLPYGTSILDPIRRTWRLLYMMEDLMLVYRAYRASDRRVFYVDTKGVPAEEEAAYVERAINSFKREPIQIPETVGGLDYRMNPMSVTDDYVVNVKGQDTATRIETLPANGNAMQLEDILYIQKQIFTAVSVPLSYLPDVGPEGGGTDAGRNLSQVNIQFARRIEKYQTILERQIHKIATIHLLYFGFEPKDFIDDLEIKFAHPSSASQDAYLNTISKRADIASSLLNIDGLVSTNWVRKEIMGWDQGIISDIRRSKIEDLKEQKDIESRKGGGEDSDGGGLGFESVLSKGIGDAIYEIDDLVDDKNSYPKVSKNAKWGSIGIPNENREIEIEPVTEFPLAGDEGDWELDLDEDFVNLSKIQNKPLKIVPSFEQPKAKKQIIKRTRGERAPIEPVIDLADSLKRK